MLDRNNILYCILAAAIVSALVSFVAKGQLAENHPKGFPAKKIYAGTPEQLRALSNGWRSLYDLPQGNPARYALNDIGNRDSWRAFNLLRGDWPGADEDRAKAFKTLEALRERIDTGLKWPYQTPPSFAIPFAAASPVLDGKINEAEWSGALTINGSYLISSAIQTADGSVWKMMWSEKYLFIGAFFSDGEVMAEEPPYKGDALEIFIMPSRRMKQYWEVVIGCDGGLFDGVHCNNRYGGFAADYDIEMKGLIYKTVRQKDGFGVEVAIPFSELPNHALGNRPQAGETLYFALVRTDKNQGDAEAKYNSAFPLLYGGHNIFGHAKGTFGKLGAI